MVGMTNQVNDQVNDKEIEKLDSASQRQKWKIINKLTDPGSRMGMQPVKADGQFVFTDEDILQEMEKVHVG